MKPIVFLGDSLSTLRGFPNNARRRAGYQIDRVQRGFDPDDWKPMPIVGSGTREIRVRDETGAFRVLYVAVRAEAVYVLHCFQKKSQRTSQSDLELGTQRYKELMRGRKMKDRRFASVWDAIEGTRQEAASLRARSELMLALAELIRRSGWTQRQAAAKFGVTQPRISDLVRGRIDLFSLDTLVDMASAGGLKPRITVKRAA
ncbi:MAG: helix-turn-helix domain-containing protein [Alphaproteobacteria bacterium]|nr:helix-turn-helix domain-containing protein [Alphaproteobacteria bacterium]